MAVTSRVRRNLTGRIRIARPAAEAFALFTPRGEERWAPGWQPLFPVPQDDGAAEGTVFETHSHGHRATWIVVERKEGCRIRYGRVVHGRDAGVVTVALAESGDTTEARVSYELTPLSDAGSEFVEAFAAGFDAFLRAWQDQITAALDHETRVPGGTQGDVGSDHRHR